MNKKITLFKVTLTFFISVFLLAGIASGFDIVLSPSNVQRAPDATVRINILTEDATDLISMGVQVSFDPAVLEAVAVSTGKTDKYIDCDEGWLMDADGDCTTTDDQYATPDVVVNNTAGTVTMIGGRLMGESTDGLDDPVLGWITFKVIGTDGKSSDLSVDFAYPDSTKYAHFVMLDGTTVDDSYTPAVVGAICVSADPCDGNVNGDSLANVQDLAVLNKEFGNSDCNAPGPGCQSDINNDGLVNVADLGLLNADFGRTDCSCP